MTPSPTDLNELLRTHTRLREIMLLASARIKRQALGHQDYELLKNMREALIESRAIARRFEKRKPVAAPPNEPGAERS
jgi:hypothetical protein